MGDISKARGEYTAQMFIEAIPGSGGIISVIAAKVGCHWITAKKYITTYPTVKAAYDAECESLIDVAESIVCNNLLFAANQQKVSKEPVDASDAKWYLTVKGKGRGYATRQEITGANGGPIPIKLIEVLLPPEGEGEQEGGA